MGTINVPGFPDPIEIEGDEPSPEEARKILQAIQMFNKQESPVSAMGADRKVVSPGLFRRTADETARRFDALKGAAGKLEGLTPLETGRQGAMMVGGTVGMQIGAAAPVPPSVKGVAIVGGAVLGNLIGLFGMETLNKVFESTGLIEKGQTLTSAELLKRGLTEAEIEAAVSMIPGAGAAVKGLAQSGARRALGLGRAGSAEDQQIQSLIRKSGRAGIDLGIVDISKTLPRAFSRIFGSFPLLGTPVKAAKQRQAVQIREGFKTLVSRIMTRKSIPETGMVLSRNATETFGAFIEEAGRLGTALKAFANSSQRFGRIIPTEKLRRASNQAIVQLERTRALGRTNERIPSSISTKLRSILNGIGDIKDRNITFGQFDGSLQDLQKLASNKNLTENEKLAIQQVKDVFDSTLRSVKNPEFQRKIAEFDSFVKKGMDTFNSQLGKQITGGIEQGSSFSLRPINIDKAGTFTGTELFNIASKSTDSVQSIKSLRSIFGPKAVHQMVRTRIDEAFELVREQIKAAKPGDRIQFEKFISELGLDNLKGSKFKALKESLRGSGLDIKDLTQFTEVTARSFESMSPNVAQFVARRGIMGGLRAIVKSLAPFATAGGSAASTFIPGVTIADAITTGGSLLAIRHMSSLISDPKTLKQLTSVIKENLPKQQRQALFLRLFFKLEGEQQTPIAAGASVGGGVSLAKRFLTGSPGKFINLRTGGAAGIAGATLGEVFKGTE